MSVRRLFAVTAAAAVALFATVGQADAQTHVTRVAALHLHAVDVCPPPAKGQVSCLATVLANSHNQPFTTPAPSGYAPSDLRTAYGLTKASPSRGAGQTVAVVDAYDDPTAEGDLAVYRSAFGLPACGTGCFEKVAQDGTTNYPKANTGWSTEISLDLDMISAICPRCHILLVEAAGADNADVETGENTAARLGATEISNSFGGSEPSDATAEDVNFHHPGIATTAATGDDGYGVEYPASSPYVLAVGGTTLNESSSGAFSETAWSGSGSGCSAYEPKPAWQASVAPDCPSNRAEADVAADADPNTGVAVYGPSDEESCGLVVVCTAKPTHGWIEVGGTSVGAPLIASVIALAGNASTFTPGVPYRHTHLLHNITTGSNCTQGSGGLLGLFGPACPDNELDNAGPGWNGPTGLGTPNGLGAF